MPTMLPALPDTFGNIRQVFPAVFASLAGQPNPFDLPKVRHAVIILVDGLGRRNLLTSESLAPCIVSGLRAEPELFSVFPSSTVANITSLATGVSPSEHGMFGYRIFDRANNEEQNLLSGLDRNTVLNYVTATSLASKNRVNVVTLPAYVDSGFTRATMYGATHFSAADIAERFAIATRLAMTEGEVTYVYVPELDQTAHALGCASESWGQQLAALDVAIAKFVKQLANDVGVLVLSDHGVIDVPSTEHLYLDEVLAAVELQSLGGDPRAAYLYLVDSADRDQVCSAVSNWLNGRGVVLTVDEAAQHGLLGEPLLSEIDLLPDLLILPSDGKALYHRGLSKPTSMKMVGQHGGLTNLEIEIPLARLAGYSSSDLVP